LSLSVFWKTDNRVKLDSSDKYTTKLLGELKNT